jgi:acetyl-CoA carboxylase biotin carboxyl carrier protein
MFNVKDMKDIQDIFKNSDVGEIEIETTEGRVRMVMGGKPAPIHAAPAPAAVSSGPASDGAAKAAEPYDNESELRSKWVGFFTRLNTKTGEYYIKLRDTVKKGDILAHVRVLGVMQDVVSDVEGKVKEILIEEGQPIEYGQPIMRFEI